MIKITINGTEYEVEPGISVLTACKRNGIKVPYFCYHPCLSIAGNCRMCLVKIEKIPKPAISCATIVNDGMVIDTNAPEIVTARERVMEFLLINHPLDCPVCDQAGECKLQDYSYKYGQANGRFKDEKVVKPTKELGTHVKYWASRCILCTRCVRFCREISGTEELAVFNRGDHAEIGIFPGREMNNPLSMNTVDVCPVGALVSADFLYQARSWNLTQKESICVDCSVGCNTRVDSLHDEIKRIQPKRNAEVNSAFMCDYGRLGFDYIHSKNRLQSPVLNGASASWKEAIAQTQLVVSEHISSNTSHNLAFLVSAWNTNESLYLVKKLKEEKLNNSHVYFYARPKLDDEVFPKFRISGDKNPNRKGIQAIFNTGPQPLDSLVDRVNKSEITTLVLLGGTPDGYVPDEIAAIVPKLNCLIVIDHSKNAVTDKAHILLPSLSYGEKYGTYINDQNRIQLASPVISPRTGGKGEDTILQEIKIALSGEAKLLSTSGVFEQMRELEAFKDLNYSMLRNGGAVLPNS